MKDLPFSFYEFLAVLMPGFIFSMAGIFLFGPIPNLKEDNLLHGLFLVSLAYVVGQVIGQFSVWVTEAIAKRILGEPALVLLRKQNGNCFLRCLFKQYYQPLREKSCNTYQQLIKATSDQDLLDATHGPVFARARMDDAENQRLNHWSRLFGFSRNMAFGSFCLAIALVPVAYFSERTELYTWSGLSLFIGFVMLYRYLRFLRTFNVDLIQWFVEQGKLL